MSARVVPGRRTVFRRGGLLTSPSATMYPLLTDRSPVPGTPSSTLFTDAWVKASTHVASSVVDANRGALSAFMVPPTSNPDVFDSVTYRRDDWAVERTVTTPDEISVGDSVRFTKRFTDDDVRAFAEASGDTNRLHLDAEYADQTRFGGRIVHGTLVAGLISAALARLPGLTIYVSQEMDFHNPVSIGDRVTAVVEVEEAVGDNRFRLRTDVEDGDTTYLSGEAVVLIDAHPSTPEETDD